jgi:hypothetical protein
MWFIDALFSLCHVAWAKFITSIEGGFTFIRREGKKDVAVGIRVESTAVSRALIVRY